MISSLRLAALIRRLADLVEGARVRRVTYGDMPPEARKHFDAAFAEMDRAFAALSEQGE